MTRAEIAFVTLAGFAIGLTLPDLDQILGIGHRSALTHSLLPAIVALSRRRWHPAACGLGGGTGLHLAADCFPNAMIGYATVKLPFAGSIGADASYAWLAVNALGGLSLAVWLARRLHAPRIALALGAFALVAGVAYLWRTDGGWPVLALTGTLGWLAWRWRRSRSSLSRSP